jgi:hypothetical protein
MRKRVVIVNDRMQKDYRYRLTARTGRDFDPEFTPTSRRRRCSGSGCSAENT